MSDSNWKDAKGREWTTRLNLGSAKSLRDNLGLDVMKDAAGLPALLQDAERLGDVLWLIHEPAAKAKRVDRDDFFAALDHDALNAGFWGLAAAVSDFSEPALRPGFNKLVELQVEAMAQVARAISINLESPETEAEIQAAVTAELAATTG